MIRPILNRPMAQSRRAWQDHWLAIGTAAVVGLLSWAGNPSLEAWELSWSGTAQEWRGLRRPRAAVTIVAIDDFSLQQAANAELSGDPQLQNLQTWPWPRRMHALILERLRAAGARAVAFDVLFDGPSLHGSADDQALIAGLQRQRGHVVLAAQVLASEGPLAGLALIPPMAPLAQAAGNATGLINGPSEADGSIRRRPGDHAEQLRQQLGPAVPPGLAVSLLKFGNREDHSRRPAAGSGWQALLDPYGPPGTVPTLPIWSVLDRQSYQALLQSGRLRDQLVLVGPTAAVFQDLHRGPFAGAKGMPGVELHATELANRLEGRTFWHWQPGRLWALALAGLTLLAGVLVERWERPLQRFFVLGGAALFTGLLGLLLAGWLGLSLHLFSAATALLVMGVVSSTEATTRLQWQRRRLRSALERYLSPAVAAEIANQPAEADGLLGGRSLEVAVLIADIRGFTARTSQMSQEGRARELVEQLNDYFTEVVAAIHAEGGTVDKFIGDAALAVFGAPLNRGAAAEAAAALRTAQSLQTRLEALNTRWQSLGKDPWQQVIVLHFGQVISGNVGSSSRMDYTVIGDAVNATSRLEGVAKSCNRDLVMSAAFVAALSSDQPLQPLGQVELRGQGSTEIYGLG